MFVDPADLSPLIMFQSNSGIQEDVFRYEEVAPGKNTFQVPEICETNPIVVERAYEFAKDHMFAQSHLEFSRMDTNLVTKLKTELETAVPFMYFKRSIASIPTSLDRRTTGNVAKVRNQGACGACWSFSSAAAMETVISVASGMPAASISPQAIIDCSPLGVKTHTNLGLRSCRGCAGGYPPVAFQNAINGTGIAMEEEYKYIDVEGSCNAYARVKKGISSYRIIQPGNEDDIIAAVAEHGAVSVLISVQEDLEFYTGGVYDNPNCGTSPAHAVTVIGYDDVSYIMKNSWGSAWGESDFFRMIRGKNMCGIANHASVPVAKIQ